jgi:hypothetical protein
MPLSRLLPSSPPFLSLTHKHTTQIAMDATLEEKKVIGIVCKKKLKNRKHRLPWMLTSREKSDPNSV